MDLTNRALIIAGALLCIFVALVIVLLAWGAPDQSIERIGDLAGYLQDHNSRPAQFIITFGGLIFVLLSALIIVYEVAPPETGSVRVQRVGSGQASIATDEIVQRLEEELGRVSQLTGVQANVIARGRKAEVNLDLFVSSDADLAAASEEACRIARELVEQRMGVQLDCAPRAQIHYRELRVARPAGPTSAAPPMPPFSTASGPPPPAESTHEASETTQQNQPTGS